MTDYVTPLVITIIEGILHIICLSGFFFLRSTPVFAARVPRVVLGSMLLKALAFVCAAWMFLDPACPCGVIPLMFWLDWTGSWWLVLKRIILLFRYEIQAAVSRSKMESNIVSLDETNFFVQYRSILRPRTQNWLMVVILVVVGAGYFVVFGIYQDRVASYCTHDKFADNSLILGSILWAWIVVVPLVALSVVASCRLRKFPKDNWKMGVENSVTSGFSVIFALACAISLLAVTEFDGLLWTVLLGSVCVSLLQICVPLTLLRQTVNKLATLDLKLLSSLDHLLLNENFAKAFEAFLRKEFSCENLFFWLEVHRLKERYSGLFCPDSRPSFGITVNRDAMFTEAAKECCALGEQFVGDLAPRQLNISGDTVDALEKILRSMRDLQLSGNSSHALGEAVEETLETLGIVQFEVYELLRKDPYPRFLVSSAATKLNHNETFKRMLAEEKLEADVQHSLDDSRKHLSTDNAHNSQSSDEKGGRTPDESKKDRRILADNDDKKKRFSSMLEIIDNNLSASSKHGIKRLSASVEVAVLETQGSLSKMQEDAPH